MIKDQSCCSHSQGMTALFFSPQSLMSQVMLGDHPAWQVLPRFTAIVFLPIAFPFFLRSSTPGSEVENILPAKVAEKSEATAEGLSWHRAGICFVFSAGTERQPQVPPQGLHGVSWPLEPTVARVGLAGVTPHLPRSSVPLFPPRTVACIHKLAPSYDLNLWLWGQQKCANIFGKSSLQCLCRSLQVINLTSPAIRGWALRMHLHGLQGSALVNPSIQCQHSSSQMKNPLAHPPE